MSVNPDIPFSVRDRVHFEGLKGTVRDVHPWSDSCTVALDGAYRVVAKYEELTYIGPATTFPL